MQLTAAAAQRAELRELSKYELQLVQLRRALTALWTVTDALHWMVCKPLQDGDSGVILFWQHKYKQLLRKYDNPSSVLYLKENVYDHFFSRHLYDEARNAAPFSIVHFASTGLEATNKIVHKISGNVVANGGISYKEQLPCTMQNACALEHAARGQV